jgi:hypothetical protein
LGVCDTAGTLPYLRFAWLCPLALAGCVRDDPNHCANKDGDATCVANYDGGFCSKCTPKFDGCVESLADITDPTCRVGGETTQVDDDSADPSTASMSSDSIADDSSNSTTATADTTSTSSSAEVSSDESSSTGSIPVCGDGSAEGDEPCDGTDIRDTNCEMHNLGEGVPTCNGDCSLNFLPCDLEADCGNAIIEGGEECEPDNLGGATCESLPDYGGGDLSCDQMCRFNVTQCTACLEILGNCTTDAQCCDQTCNDLLGC